MPRSGPVKKRPIEADPLYNSKLVTRFVNRVMRHGKKSLARKIVYGALESISTDRREALRVLERATQNVMPQMEVRPRRVGGATYQVPLPVPPDRSETLAVRWIIQAAQARKGIPMVKALADEIKAAAQGEGEAFRRKEEVHRLAEANRAFAHFRW